MFLFKSQFYLASNSDNSLPAQVEKYFKLSTRHIGTLGELYSGTLISNLGHHFEIYNKQPVSPVRWMISNNSSGIKTGRIVLQNEKQKTQAVSGNIGEVLIIPGISNALNIPMRHLGFHRIKAHQMKCPDYRISLSSLEIKKLWPRAKTPTIMPDLPLEVKSSLSNDNYYPVEALQQLYEYWKECNNPAIQGYGLIARVNIDETETCIRYYLFIRNKSFSMKRFRSIAYAKNLKKANGRIESKQKRIANTIGRMFE
ncbi:hypothetical protein [Planococcus rifietoensis]|uniref:hypothetical protein n=1 Tax=Planococcus rifietoensis TaxID=200991 RepID=UPI00384D0D90